MLFDLLFREAPAAQLHDQKKGNRAKDASRQRKRPRRHVHEPPDEPDGTENDHRDDEFDFCSSL